jgi:biopolymer transport protein ExbD
MAIAIGGAEERPMSDINTTPLVDVMLVLLIIFLITVSTTDAAGRSAGEPGYEGASRSGECRVYFNDVTPVDSQELYNRAYERLDAIVQRAGGASAIMEDPEKIPQVIIRGDVNAPWRCIAGTIHNVQAAGYPTVGFISHPKDVG